MKNVAYIGNLEDAEIFLDNSMPKDDLLCVAGDAFVVELLTSKGFQNAPIEDYCDMELDERSQERAIGLSGDWFLDASGMDITKIYGISFGVAMKRNAAYFFNYAIKSYNVILKVIEQERPENIILIKREFDGNYSNLLECPDYIMISAAISVIKALERPRVIYIKSGGIDGIKGYIRRTFKLFSLVKQPLFKNKLIIYCPKIILFIAKKVLIRAVDNYKNLTRKKKPRAPHVTALCLGVSDFSYIGFEFINSFTLKHGNILFYIEDENNCFFSKSINHLELDKYNNDAVSKKTRKKILSLKEAESKIHAALVGHCRFSFDGIDLYPLIRPFLSFLFRREFPSLLRLVFSAERAIEDNGINILLVSDRFMPKRIVLINLFKNMGLPSLHIPHGSNDGFVIGDGTIFQHPLLDIRSFPFHSTHEVHLLKYNKEMQMLRGLSPSAMTVTGLAKYVRKNLTEAERIKARDRLGIPSDGEVVLYAATTTSHHSNRYYNHHYNTFDSFRFYKEIFDVFSRRENCRLLIKFKPSDPIATNVERVSWFRRRPSNCLLYTDSLHDLLIACDVLLVTATNVGIEGLFYQRPVIQICRLNEKRALLQLAHCGAAVGVEGLSEVPSVLDRLRDDPGFRQDRLKAQEEFLRENLPGEGISSDERIMNVIRSLIQEN